MKQPTRVLTVMVPPHISVPPMADLLGQVAAGLVATARELSVAVRGAQRPGLALSRHEPSLRE